MLAALRPLRAAHSAHLVRSSLQHSRRAVTMSAAAGLQYPKPIVYPSASKHESTLIMVHGLDLPNTQFVFPTAPVRPITINGGMPGTGWYDIRSLDKLASESEDAEAMLESKRYIESLIEQQQEAGIPSERIVVGGFSQGGAMALMMLRSKMKLAGVVGLSCYLLLHEQLRIVSDENKATPVLMCHGDSDPVVDYEFGRKSFEQLKEAGVNVELNTYRYMGHEACQEELVAMRDFLRSCLYPGKK